MSDTALLGAIIIAGAVFTLVAMVLISQVHRSLLNMWQSMINLSQSHGDVDRARREWQATQFRMINARLEQVERRIESKETTDA